MNAVLLDEQKRFHWGDPRGGYARVIEDSISIAGQRIVTVEVRHERFLLAEFNTHRRIAKNSRSSRAMPTGGVEGQPRGFIEEVQDHPFVPEFHARVKGMGIGEKLDEQLQCESQDAWRRALDANLASARELSRLGVDKSRANRLLEPFAFHTAIYTATDWRNFFALRCPPVGPDPDFPAQIEFQRAAVLMREAFRGSEPRSLLDNEWHLPYVTEDERAVDWSDSLRDQHKVWQLKRLSARRCARISYGRQHEAEELERALEAAAGLQEAGHMSPFDHQARPLTAQDLLVDTYDVLIPSRELRRAFMVETALTGGGKLLQTVDHTADRIDLAKCYGGHLRGWLPYRKELRDEDDHSTVLDYAHELGRGLHS